MLINNIIFIDSYLFAASTIVDGTVNIWKLNPDNMLASLVHTIDKATGWIDHMTIFKNTLVVFHK